MNIQRVYLDINAIIDPRQRQGLRRCRDHFTGQGYPKTEFYCSDILLQEMYYGEQAEEEEERPRRGELSLRKGESVGPKVDEQLEHLEQEEVRLVLGISRRDVGSATSAKELYASIKEDPSLGVIFKPIKEATNRLVKGQEIPTDYQLPLQEINKYLLNWMEREKPRRPGEAAWLEHLQTKVNALLKGCEVWLRQPFENEFIIEALRLWSKDKHDPQRMALQNLFFTGILQSFIEYYDEHFGMRSLDQIPADALVQWQLGFQILDVWHVLLALHEELDFLTADRHAAALYRLYTGHPGHQQSPNEFLLPGGSPQYYLLPFRSTPWEICPERVLPPLFLDWKRQR